jgi:hypothetical protein
VEEKLRTDNKILCSSFDFLYPSMLEDRMLRHILLCKPMSASICADAKVSDRIVLKQVKNGSQKSIKRRKDLFYLIVSEVSVL